MTISGKKYKVLTRNEESGQEKEEEKVLDGKTGVLTKPVGDYLDQMAASFGKTGAVHMPPVEFVDQMIECMEKTQPKKGRVEKGKKGKGLRGKVKVSEIGDQLDRWRLERELDFKRVDRKISSLQRELCEVSGDAIGDGVEVDEVCDLITGVLANLKKKKEKRIQRKLKHKLRKSNNK